MTTPSQAVIVRPATSDDLAAVVELCLLVERQHETYWPLRWQLKADIRPRYERWLEANVNASGWLIAVAELAHEPGAVVGSLVAGLLDDIPIYADVRYAFIHDMAVADATRRQGVGRELVRYAAAWARSQGVRQLRLMAAEPNAPAVRLFQSVGFRTTYHEMVLPLAP